MRSLEYPFASLLAQPHHHNRLDESAQQLLVWNSSPLFLSQRNGTSKLKNWDMGISIILLMRGEKPMNKIFNNVSKRNM